MWPLVLRVAERDTCGHSCGNRHSFIIGRGLNEHPGGRIARLAAIAETMPHSARDRCFKPGIRKDDIGRFATQFLRHPLDRVSRRFGNLDTSLGRTGERHHIDLWMTGQRAANPGTSAVDHVEHTGWKASLIDELGEKLGREWRDFARFEDHGATCHQRRANLGRELVDRPVPRRDQHAHADGFVHQPAAGTNRSFPCHRARGLDRFLQMAGTTFGLRIEGEIIGRTHFSRDGVDHLIIAPLKDRDQLFGERYPVVERHGGIAIKRASGGGNRQINIVRTAQRDGRCNLFCRRIDRIKCCLRTARQHPLAIDIGFQHGLRRTPLRVFDRQLYTSLRANSARPPKGRSEQGSTGQSAARRRRHPLVLQNNRSAHRQSSAQR